MLLATTALSGLMAGVIQIAPQTAPPAPAPPVVRQDPATAPSQSADQPAPATQAAEPPQDAEDATDLGTVTVTGVRARGSVDSDIPPDVTLSSEELQAYGASTIEELLTYLEPLTRSSRGRGDGQPVTLVNGRRTTGFREIAGIPPEAIERVDILPEEVALQYGYRADQRVVNFVLKASFQSLSGQATATLPTEGGRTTLRLGGNGLNIAGASRTSVDIDLSRSTPLYETERDIVREPNTDEALAFRTLLSETEQAQIRGTYKRDLNTTTQATVSASLQDTSTGGFNGLPGVTLTVPGTNPFAPAPTTTEVGRFLNDPAALRRETDTLTGEVGVVLDGFLGEDWRWTLSGEAQRVETDTTTGRGYGAQPFQGRVTAGDPTANPFGPLNPADFTLAPFDTARSVSQGLEAELNLNGDLFELPAGEVSSTFSFEASTRSLDSSSVRSGVAQSREQSRDVLEAEASFDIPITDTVTEVLPMFGDLSANINLGYQDVSDFGGLTTFGAGLNWQPLDPLSFLVSYTDEQGAPTIGQLNDPVLSTPEVPVFDFRTGETVLVTRIDGGNPNLEADNRKVWKAGVTWRPLKDGDLTLNSTYTRSTTDNPINAFPAITPDLEAALPERFVRDADGNLLSFDARPLNFDRAERQDIRTGFNFSRAFGRARPAAAGAPGAGGPGVGVRPGGMVMMGGPPGGGDRGSRGGENRVFMGGPGGGPGGGGPGGGRGGGGSRMQPGQGRFNLSIYHTYRLQDEIVIRDGLPTLDLLDGSATSARGGSPRHEVQLQAGLFRNGFGGFLNANWRDSTRIDGGAGPDLRFADQTTVNLNVFMDLSQRTSWVERYPILKGSRINLGVQNLFDSEVQVTSTAGDVPLNYQPDFLDPLGRTVSLTFRKILF